MVMLHVVVVAILRETDDCMVLAFIEVQGIIKLIIERTIPQALWMYVHVDACTYIQVVT